MDIAYEYFNIIVNVHNNNNNSNTKNYIALFFEVIQSSYYIYSIVHGI